jgi:hypothetical protein
MAGLPATVRIPVLIGSPRSADRFKYKIAGQIVDAMQAIHPPSSRP